MSRIYCFLSFFNFLEITFPIPNNNLMYKMVINFDLCVCVYEIESTE